MLDPFAPMPIEVRRAQRSAYRAFITERDGAADIHRRTLTRREAGMARFTKPLSRLRELDKPAFDAQYAAFDAHKKTSPELLLLLGMVKVNAAEAFGVSMTFAKVLKRALAGDDDLELLLLIEETYHTRILLSSACLYGLEVTAPYKPPSGLRVLIGGIANTPESISRPLVLASEILGTLLFANLLTLARKVLKHDPELRDSIEERIVEVLVDEIGHISFNRMCMGPLGLAQTRLILPLVAAAMVNAVPELRVLGAMPSDPGSALALFADPQRLPDVVRRQAFFA